MKRNKTNNSSSVVITFALTMIVTSLTIQGYKYLPFTTFLMLLFAILLIAAGILFVPTKIKMRSKDKKTRNI
ncbi:hypothetical protein GCM10008967_13020 [Bacillus carboniphilus]|uniref:Uncharacterized protein n=1 Tax=Bacillus carboniphilus TaxID=86663 RepID=A0ABN0W360_9BACI